MNSIPIVAVALGIDLVVACGKNEPKQEPENTLPDPSPAPEFKVAYEVTKDTVMGRFKRTVEIQLKERITEDELRWIAAQVMPSGKTKVDRTFIGYRLSTKHPSAYWATTHHDPDIKVRIQGFSKEAFEEISTQKLPPKYADGLVGVWLYESMQWIDVISKKGSKLFLAVLNADGEEVVYDELVTKKVDGVTQYRQKSSEHDEYFVVGPEGDLVFWGSGDSPFYWAPPLGDPNLQAL